MPPGEACLPAAASSRARRHRGAALNAGAFATGLSGGVSPCTESFQPMGGSVAWGGGAGFAAPTPAAEAGPRPTAVERRGGE